MKLCVVSHKQVWRVPGSAGRFATDGGTPFQVEAIGSLFDETEWVVCERPAPTDSSGNIVPESLRVALLPQPYGRDLIRKVCLTGTMGYYLARIAARVARADAVHAVVPGDIGMLGMLVALALRKPLFVRYCGGWPNTGETTRMSRLCKQLMIRCSGGRNVMLATGLGTQPPGGEVRWVFATSISVADLTRLQELRAGRAQEAARCRLLFAGRLSPEKGLLNLLEAFAQVIAAGSTADVSLTLAGHGPQLPVLQERVRALGLGERVRFTGLLNQEGVQRELSQADLFVLPSLTEGFPSALLESMAAGIPAVATSVGAVPMILEDAGEYGLVVPPGDVEALAAAIRSLIADPARRDVIGRSAQARVRAWTLEAWAEQIGAVLEESWGVPLKGSIHAGRTARVS